MNKKNKVAVLAIGTEVTSGQIVNRNTAWLSQKMEELGFETLLHLAVPDDRELMLQALKICAENAEYIFTTGGLGPTTDDFTRHVIAEFLNKKLQFDQKSLDKIVETMTLLKRPFLESQKQQCYFPEGSQVLFNSAGTANAFFFENEYFKLAVLPGPPQEVAAIWDHSLRDLMASKKPVESDHRLFRWACMGKPEAELAEKVESLVQGSRLKTGYRLNAPYVEIKLWCESRFLFEQQSYLDAVDKALDEFTIFKDDNDPWTDFFSAIQSFSSLEIWDEASEGLLTSKLGEHLRSQKQNLTQTILHTSWNGSMTPASTAHFQMHVFPIRDDSSFEIELKIGDKSCRLIRKSPFAHKRENERSRMAAAEISIIEANHFFAEIEDKA